MVQVAMPDAPTYNETMDSKDTHGSECAQWRESLARSKTQIAAGESVDLLPILDRLRAAAERLEAEQGVTADGEKVSVSR